MAKVKFNTMYGERAKQKPSKYPESKVMLDPTCTLEQILNRAQYGMAIPQRDVSGDLTRDEMEILGIDGTSLATMSRMELIDLRMRAQMRMNANKARELKKQQAAEKEAIRQGLLDEMRLEQEKQRSE